MIDDAISNEETEDANEESEFLFDDEIKELWELVEKNAEWQQKLDEILCHLQTDPLKTQSELILLVQSILQSHSGKKLSHLNEIQLKQLIAKFTKQIIKKLQDPYFGLKDVEIEEQDDFEHLTPQSKKQLKYVIKQFLIYEAYKILTPRKIAGKTKMDTFIYNLILRGLEKAMKYSNMSEFQIQKIPNKYMKKLMAARKQFKQLGELRSVI